MIDGFRGGEIIEGAEEFRGEGFRIGLSGRGLTKMMCAEAKRDLERWSDGGGGLER